MRAGVGMNGGSVLLSVSSVGARSSTKVERKPVRGGTLSALIAKTKTLTMASATDDLIAQDAAERPAPSADKLEAITAAAGQLLELDNVFLPCLGRSPVQNRKHLLFRRLLAVSQQFRDCGF